MHIIRRPINGLSRKPDICWRCQTRLLTISNGGQELDSSVIVPTPSNHKTLDGPRRHFEAKIEKGKPLLTGASLKTRRIRQSLEIDVSHLNFRSARCSTDVRKTYSLSGGFPQAHNGRVFYRNGAVLSNSTQKLASYSQEARRTYYRGRQLALNPGMGFQVELRPIYDGIPHEMGWTVPVRDQLAKWQETYGTRNIDILDDTSPDIDPQFQGTKGMKVRSEDDIRNPENEIELDDCFSTPGEFGDIKENLADVVYVKEGDLVEVHNRFANSTVLAVCCREVGRQLQLYTCTGKWVHRRLLAPQFKIPGFVTPEEIKPILPYLPTEEISEEEIDRAKLLGWDVPRTVSAPLVTKLNNFLNESKEVYRENAARLDGAHKILANETTLRFATLKEIANTLLYNDPESPIGLAGPQLFAVHKALRLLNFEFATDQRSHRVTTIFQIRSLKEVKLVEAVQNWIREFQDWVAQEGLSPAEIDRKPSAQASEGAHIIHGFIQKARMLVATSRETRQPVELGWIGPSKIQYKINKRQNSIAMWTSITFTREESWIIRFLENTCINRKFKASPELSGLAASLVRLVNRNVASGTLGNAQIHCFLQELGVLQPWENRVPYEDTLILLDGEHPEPINSPPEHDYTAADLPDSMKDLRKDWKDMDVFCIDNEGAKEIDDGISLERIDGVNEYWIHIHIANPTAFLSPGHKLSKMAANMVESLYFPEKDWPMLPPSVTQQFFSLARDRPVLTFSVRLDGQGEVLDKKITNGTVRNVITVNLDQLNHVLGFSDLRANVSLTVGTVPPNARPKAKKLDLTAEQADDLKLLEVLARKRFAHRQKAGGQHFHHELNDVAVYTRASGPGIPLSLPSHKVARYFHGDPAIQLRGKEYSSSFKSPDNTSMLVTEMMLMCCEVAASWAAERSLPILYRGTVDNPNLQDRAAFIEKNIKPLTDKNLPVPLMMARKLIRLGGQTAIWYKPFPHKYIGVTHYTKVTSPLRRYGDMVTHWQIEAALREEARTGKSLAGEFDLKPWLAIPPKGIMTLAKRLLPREKLIVKAKQCSHEHWVAQLFFRAFHFGQATLKDELTVILVGGSTTNPWIAATILEYGCACCMHEPKLYGFGWDGQSGSGEAPPEIQAGASGSNPEEGNFGWRVGDTWAVAIDKVDPFMRSIFVKPLRLINREIPIV